MTCTDIKPGDALIVVDVQNDFCPGGALDVPDGDAVVEPLNECIAEAERAGAIVLATGDLHPQDHVSFASRGGPWPPHCVRGTRGAEFHPNLKLPGDAWIEPKGQERNRDAYPAFQEADLAGRENVHDARGRFAAQRRALPERLHALDRADPPYRVTVSPALRERTAELRRELEETQAS